jgi:hypothetical protein
LLQVVAKGAQFSGKESDVNNYRLNIDHQPDYKELHKWAEYHMMSTGAVDFQSALDIFVIRYTTQPEPLPQVSTRVLRSQESC